MSALQECGWCRAFHCGQCQKLQETYGSEYNVVGGGETARLEDKQTGKTVYAISNGNMLPIDNLGESDLRK